MTTPMATQMALGVASVVLLGGPNPDFYRADNNTLWQKAMGAHHGDSDRSLVADELVPVFCYWTLDTR